MIKYLELESFKKDFKKLKKKFISLNEDFIMVKKAAIELFHINKIDNKSVFELQGFKSKEQIYKIKKFACKSLKGRGVKSGIRVIYADDFESGKITFLEIYFKGNQEVENRNRILNYLKNKN